MSGSNAFLYIVLVALAAFGIYSGFKADGLEGGLRGLLLYGAPVLLAVLVLALASRKRKKK